MGSHISGGNMLIYNKSFKPIYNFCFRQQERDEAELKRIAEKRRKEKIADAEARARVKKQIEEDRRARNAKYDEKHEEEMKAKQAELDEIKGI